MRRFTGRCTGEANRSLEGRLKETRSEIEALREALEAVRLEALTDPLTGIANRKHSRTRFSSRSRRRASAGRHLRSS